MPQLDVIQDRSAGQKIGHIALSTKQDLVAYSIGKGEVTIFNNDWMKVASYKPSDILSSETVAALAWRPDGRALAIAYSSGKLLVKNVETHETIAEFTLDDPTEWLDWSPSYWTPAEMDALSAKRQFDDRTHTCLQEIHLTKSPSVGGGETSSREPEKATAQLQMRNQRTLSILSLITTSKKLHLYAFGFLPLALVDLKETSELEIARVCQFYMSRDFDALVVVVQDTDHLMWELVYDTSVIRRHYEEIEILAKHSDYLWAYRKTLEASFKRLTTMKDDSRQELEDAIKLLLKQFERDFNAAKAVRPSIVPSITRRRDIEELSERNSVTVSTVVGKLPCISNHSSALGRQRRPFLALGATRKLFDRAFQDGASFLLKLFEVQHVVEKDAKRCHTTVSWLISQAEILNPPDNGGSLRKFTETDLDAVVSVLKDLFGDNPLPPADNPDEQAPWKMRHFGIDVYLTESDLTSPLDPSHSPFQPYYEKLQSVLEEKEANGFATGPYLGAFSALQNSAFGEEKISHHSDSALFTFHRTKTARQELTAFIQSLELAFSNVITVVSQALSVRRKELLIDGCDENARVAIYPVGRAEEISAGGQTPNFIQLACTQWEGGRQSLVIVKHDIRSGSSDNDGRLDLPCDLLATINPLWRNLVILGVQPLRDAFVIFVKNNPDGEVVMLQLQPVTLESRNLSQQLSPLLLKQARLTGVQSLGSSSNPDLISANGLLSVMAVVMPESRIRLFRLPDSKPPAIVDDTDKIAEEIRPDMSAAPA
ncbi:hypothetical protein BV898_15538 [Hypsibius exemplaris]|uniref:Anaphase-promoting complex subunit 4-like WD40 domain-containing protein n=1 Tax=Hypsibius exemplaris TaxID=2072580 RepID=A0A9X6RKT6_HYPEX|nr:hypothetical protein BV898_15538 [Hypsibius exemplaris]